MAKKFDVKSFMKKYYLLFLVVGFLIVGLKMGGYLGVISTYNITTALCPIVANGAYQCTTNTTVPYDNTTLKISGNIDPTFMSGGISSFSATCGYKTQSCVSILNEWCTNYIGLTKNCGITFKTISSPNVAEPKYSFSSTTTKICNEGEKKCITASTLQTCISGGTEWSIPYTCSSGQLCSNGSCINKPTVCEEQALDSYQCSGDVRQQKYRATDCDSEFWKTVETCPEKCNDGVCVNVASQPEQLTAASTTEDIAQVLEQQKQNIEDAQTTTTETECVVNSDCPHSTVCDVNISGLCEEGTCKTQEEEVNKIKCDKFDLSGVGIFLDKYGLILGGAVAVIGISGAFLFVRKKGSVV